jgi:outer membrane immunogenic protein
MTIRYRLLLATALSIVGGGAFAADLPMRSAPPAMLSPISSYNWTGFYIGVNGGYGWGSQNPLALLPGAFISAPGKYSVSGGLFGGTAGAQIQSGHVVLGLEADADWAGVKGNSTVPTFVGGLPVTLRLSSQTDGFATLRTRFGYAADNWLFYGTGGIAVLNSSVTGASIAGVPCGTLGVLPNCQSSSLRPGIAAGLGVEYGFTQNWSAKVEYLWTGVVSGASTENVNTIRAGLNYRFGG